MSAQPTEIPADVTAGTVLRGPGGHRWVCRTVHPTRGPLFAPESAPADVRTTIMASVEELEDQGFGLLPVDDVTACHDAELHATHRGHLAEAHDVDALDGAFDVLAPGYGAVA